MSSSDQPKPDTTTTETSQEFERLVLWCMTGLRRSNDGDLDVGDIPQHMLDEASDDTTKWEEVGDLAIAEARRRYRRHRIAELEAEEEQAETARLLDGAETDRWHWIHKVLPETEEAITQDVVGLARALSVLRVHLRYDLRAAEVQWNFVRTVFPKEYGWTPESGEPWESGEWWALEGNPDRDRPVGIQYMTEPPEDWWVPTNDLIDGSMKQVIETCFVFDTGKPARFTKDQWQVSVDALSRKFQIDPFREWVTLLRWDGKPRLEHWLERAFEFTDETPTDLIRWAAKQILTGACKRTADPGAKMDQMVVLCGKQGARKSTVLAHLLPPDRRKQWFSDSYNFLLPEKERVESTLGTVIVEIAEMVGSKREDVARIKNDMSKQVDRVRLAYRRNGEQIPRRHVRVGTTNDPHDLPNDPTGLRRFVPLDIASTLLGVSEKEIEEWFQEPQYTEEEIRSELDPSIHTTFESLSGTYREQLWAEAWERKDEDGALYTAGRLNNLAAAAAERHRYADQELEEVMDEILSSPKAEAGLSTNEIMDLVRGVNRHWESVNQARVKRVLQLKGWQYRQPKASDGKEAASKRSRRWFAPKRIEDEPTAESSESASEPTDGWNLDEEF